MSDVLLLNGDGSPMSVIPLSTIPWQDAMRLMYLDRIQILEWYDDWIVRSPSMETRVPAVAMLKEYIRVNNTPKFSRSNITLRDRFKCQYCGDAVTLTTVTMDHVVPASRGGATSWDNIVASCMPCNSRKGDRRDIHPRVPPRQPTYWELVKIRKDMHINYRHPSWQEYLA